MEQDILRKARILNFSIFYCSPSNCRPWELTISCAFERFSVAHTLLSVCLGRLVDVDSRDCTKGSCTTSGEYFYKIRTDNDHFLRTIDRGRLAAKSLERSWREAERLESFEMFIFSCVDIAPRRRVLRKLCLLLPMLFVKMPAKHRIYFCCETFVSCNSESVKHSPC